MTTINALDGVSFLRRQNFYFLSNPASYCIKFVLFYAVQTFFCRHWWIISDYLRSIKGHYKNTDSNILTIGVLIFSYCWFLCFTCCYLTTFSCSREQSPNLFGYAEARERSDEIQHIFSTQNTLLLLFYFTITFLIVPSLILMMLIPGRNAGWCWPFRS